MKKEQVLVIIKPDIMAKGLVGHVLSRLSELNLEFVAMKVAVASKSLAEEHYIQLKDQPFFGDIVNYLQGKLHGQDKLVVIIFAGKEAIRRCREIAGATNPEEADPKSIRGSLGRITTKGVYENAVHVSSTPEEAEREIKLWFTPDEIISSGLATKTKNLKSHSIKVWA